MGYVGIEGDRYVSLKKVLDITAETGALETQSRIRKLPYEDVAPVVHSQWKYKCGEIQCPECENKIRRIDLSGCLNFCPNCGAKMDG